MANAGGTRAPRSMSARSPSALPPRERPRRSSPGVSATIRGSVLGDGEAMGEAVRLEEAEEGRASVVGDEADEGAPVVARLGRREGVARVDPRLRERLEGAAELTPGVVAYADPPGHARRLDGESELGFLHGAHGGAREVARVEEGLLVELDAHRHRLPLGAGEGEEGPLDVPVARTPRMIALAEALDGAARAVDHDLAHDAHGLLEAVRLEVVRGVPLDAAIPDRVARPERLEAEIEGKEDLFAGARAAHEDPSPAGHRAAVHERRDDLAGEGEARGVDVEVTRELEREEGRLVGEP